MLYFGTSAVVLAEAAECGYRDGDSVILVAGREIPQMKPFSALALDYLQGA